LTEDDGVSQQDNIYNEELKLFTHNTTIARIIKSRRFQRVGHELGWQIQEIHTEFCETNLLASGDLSNPRRWAITLR
jgi:hypothetical protein